MRSFYNYSNFAVFLFIIFINCINIPTVKSQDNSATDTVKLLKNSSRYSLNDCDLVIEDYILSLVNNIKKEKTISKHANVNLLKIAVSKDLNCSCEIIRKTYKLDTNNLSLGEILNNVIEVSPESVDDVLSCVSDIKKINKSQISEIGFYLVSQKGLDIKKEIKVGWLSSDTSKKLISFGLSKIDIEEAVDNGTILRVLSELNGGNGKLEDYLEIIYDNN